MMKNKISVILTSAGGQIAPSLISMMRKNNSYNVTVIGVDAASKDGLVGRHFCDDFYRVPYAMNKGYVSSMLKICKTNKVSIVFPASDEEALLLSGSRGRFNSIGTKIACSSRHAIETCLDKYSLMKTLEKNGIPMGKFYELGTINDLKKYSSKLGYPKEDVVIKPRTGRGSRGFRIITEKFSLYEKFSKNEFYLSTLEEILNIFKNKSEKLKSFFLMEYLAGERYSVDIIVKNSQPVTCVARRKIFPVSSPTQIADIVHDQDIIDYARNIARALKTDYFVQVEIGRDNYNKPCLIEINPRIDATLPIVEGIGHNYFEEMID